MRKQHVNTAKRQCGAVVCPRKGVVMLGLGHSASKPKDLFVHYMGCLPHVSMPSIGMQLV